MNIIKENLFFVVMGVVVLLALVLFVVLVQPLRAENDRIETEVRDLVRDMDRLVNGKLPNVAAMVKASAYNKEFDNQVTSVVEDLKAKHLLDTLPGLDRTMINDPGAFKSVYADEIAKLKKQLSDRRIDTASETWHFWNWGESVPGDPAQRVLASKEIALAAELISILIRSQLELGVTQVDRIEINPNEQRTGDYKAAAGAGGRVVNRVGPYFDVFPFILEVRMPVQRYEILLRELLQGSKSIPIYIRKVSMTRIDDDPRVTRKIPPLIIGVRVEGWALDYNTQDRRPTSVVRGGAVPNR